MKKATLIGTGNILGQGLAFLFLTLLARWMTTEDYGEIRFLISIAVLAATVVAAGLPTTMTRFLAKYNCNPKKRNVYFSNMIAIFLFMLLATEIVVALIYQDELIIILLILGYSVPLLYMGIVRGLMQYKKFSIAMITRNILKIIILFAVFYFIGITNISVLLIYSFGGWLAILLLEAIWPSGLRFKSSAISKPIIKKIVVFSVPIMLTTIAYSILTAAPIILLKSFWNYDTVAIYSTALTFTIVYGFVPTAILTIIMPKIASMNDLNERLKIFRQSVCMIIATGILLWLGTLFMGKWVLVFLFTAKYEMSYLPLLILSVGIIFAGLRNAFSALWEGGGRPIISTYDTAVGAIVAIFVAILAIPTYGPEGAAIAFTIGWMASVTISSYFWIKLKRGKMELK